MYSFYSVFCLIIHFRSHFLSFSYFKLCVRLSIATLELSALSEVAHNEDNKIKRQALLKTISKLGNSLL